jgi:hypothetical protein
MSRQSTAAEDREVGATLRALRRAARRALELGVRTGTPVYVIQNHRIVDLTKQDASAPLKQINPRGTRKSK